MSIPFDNTYARLPERFYAKQAAERAPSPRLIKANLELASLLGIPGDWLESEDATAGFSGNAIPEGAEPLAQAYAGHQFGHFVAQLGDGRALLLGEVVGTDGKRRDIQLKGSGRTPFSRNGDGKAGIGPVLREYLVSEAVAALGIPTTRALAAVTTGETIFRQEGEVPGAVIVRVAASHLRIGTFEYFWGMQDVEGLRVLADYAIDRHYPEARVSDCPYLKLLESVIVAQARLIPQWMAVGFIHGVMNTDNCSISGETIDFGPCAFMDAFHPARVFSSIDARGRYAWNNQPDIALWNLTRLAETLLPLLAEETQEAVAMAESALEKYPPLFKAQYQRQFKTKLALPEKAPMDIVDSCLKLLAEQAVDFTIFFRELTRSAEMDTFDSMRSLFEEPTAFDEWKDRWLESADLENLLPSMKKANPVLIPRNHRVEEAIQAAYREDYAPFHRLLEALADPFAERPEFADLEAAPLPNEVVTQTFCGT